MRRLTAISTFGLLATLSAPLMAADDKVPTNNGYYGNILFGAGYLALDSNTLKGNQMMEIGNDTIVSVNQSAQSESDAYPFFSGEIGWTFGDRWQVFFGNDIADLVTLDFAQRLGLRKQWDGVGVVGLALQRDTIPGEVWEDPYLAGTARSDTDRTSKGMRFDWWRILGTNFYVQAKLRSLDIEDEKSGTDPVLGLTPDEISTLQRDGDDSRFFVGYSWESGPHMVRPELIVGQDERDGSALNNDSVGAGLTYVYRGVLWTLVATGEYREDSYDENNPIYEMKADNSHYQLGFTVFRKLDLGDGGWSAVGSVAYGDDDSDINFLDSTALNLRSGR